MSKSPQDTPVPGEDVSAATHAFLLLCGLLVVGFVAWAVIGRLEVVSSAVGEVIPSSQVKSIQHLEGGIVREILVREGDRVEQGQALVSLEPTSRGADVGELSVRMTSLRVDVVRLVAEAEAEDAPTFPEDLAKDHPNLVAEALQLFDARRQRLDGQLAAQRESIEQRRQQVMEISARLNNRRQKLKLLNEQVRISEELLRDDLTNRMLHLNLLKERAGLRGDIGEDEAAITRSKASIKEAELRLQSLRDGVVQEAREQLDQKRRELHELEERLAKFEDTLERTVLRSPVAGLVKSLYVFTVGGVVSPGGTVADVVPEGDRLVVEAKLPVQDVGYVHAGQTATVRLASADAMRFGDLEGKVVHVSPDALEGEDGLAYYRVRIETKRDYFERKKLRYRLVPGVQVLCNIRTGERSVLEYLLDPFLGSFRTALRER